MIVTSTFATDLAWSYDILVRAVSFVVVAAAAAAAAAASMVVENATIVSSVSALLRLSLPHSLIFFAHDETHASKLCWTTAASMRA